MEASICVTRALVRSSDQFRWNFPTPDKKKPVSPHTFSRNFMTGNIVIFQPYHDQTFIRLENLQKGYNENEGLLVRKAFDLAWRGHLGVFREDSLPYIEHVLAVAEIVKERGLGAEEVAAALCHDLIEDSRIGNEKVTKAYLARRLGERVAFLVDGVSELGKGEADSEGLSPSKVDISRKFVSYGNADLAVIVIKLADRLHNMRTLASMPKIKQMKKALETLGGYVPLADALGMWEIKRELEDLSFYYIDEPQYHGISAKRSQIDEATRSDIVALAEKLAVDEKKPKIVVEKRGVYEIYDRMKRRGLSLEDLSASDIWRINLVVEDYDAAFSILGRIQLKYPRAQGATGEFHNYYAIPLPN
ncbi:MAG: HD domain-containing protein, partial [Candidatus Margulisiibacteriota bacterium]